MISEQIYSDVAELIALLKANSQGEKAEILEHRMFRVSWTSSSELLQEIASLLEKLEGELITNQKNSSLREKVKSTINTIKKSLEQENRRSLVRVKIWSLETAFLACWLVLRFGNLARGSEDLVLAMAGVTAILFYFVRCEQCHTSEILRRSGWLRFVKWNGLFPSKRCPVCGKERF